MVQRHTRKTRTIEVWLLDTSSIASGHKAQANQENGEGREREGGGVGWGGVGDGGVLVGWGVGNVEVGEWGNECSSSG